jgi:hypothetical protein
MRSTDALSDKAEGRWNMAARCIGAIVAVVLGLTGAVQASTIHCNGSESGGTGPRSYYYVVTISPGEPGDVLQELRIGTDDLVAGNYSNWIQPDGWAPVPFDYSVLLDADVKTPHGETSPGPTGNSLGAVTWKGPALGAGTYYFGFNNSHSSHDVGWFIFPGGQQGPISEDWEEPVGMGTGPVHGPVPEPATLALMALGGLVLIRRRRTT